MAAAQEANDKQAQAYLPDFCAAGTVLVILLVAELVAILLTLVSYQPGNFLTELSKMSMFVLWLALLGTIVLCQIRPWAEKQGNTRAFVICFVVLEVMCLLLAQITWQLTGIFAEATVIDATYGQFLLRTFATSSIVIALAMRYLYISSEWRRSIVLEAQARISALQALIRPHFLFNSMNTIASLISFMPEKAEKAIEDLADLFRASLKEQNIHTLKDEIEITRSYLDIEKLRLGERLEIDWNVDNSLFDAEIPALSLQPLAENAIYHGIEPIPDGGKIRISAQRDGEHLKLEVSNPASEATGLKRTSGNQMAQDNIKQRLRLAYGNDAAFYINATKLDYTVTLEIPVTLL